MRIEDYEQARTEAIVTGGLMIIAMVVMLLVKLYDTDLMMFRGYAITIAYYSAGVGGAALLLHSQIRKKHHDMTKCTKDIIHLITLTWMTFLGSVLFLIMALILMGVYKYYIIG